MFEKTTVHDGETFLFGGEIYAPPSLTMKELDVLASKPGHRVGRDGKSWICKSWSTTPYMQHDLVELVWLRGPVQVVVKAKYFQNGHASEDFEYSWEGLDDVPVTAHIKPWPPPEPPRLAAWVVLQKALVKIGMDMPGKDGQSWRLFRIVDGDAPVHYGNNDRRVTLHWRRMDGATASVFMDIRGGTLVFNEVTVQLPGDVPVTTNPPIVSASPSPPLLTFADAAQMLSPGGGGPGEILGRDGECWGTIAMHGSTDGISERIEITWVRTDGVHMDVTLTKAADGTVSEDIELDMEHTAHPASPEPPRPKLDGVYRRVGGRMAIDDHGNVLLLVPGGWVRCVVQPDPTDETVYRVDVIDDDDLPAAPAGPKRMVTV